MVRSWGCWMLWLVVASGPLWPQVSTKDVSEITIGCFWGGLGTPLRAKFVIRPQEGAFLRQQVPAPGERREEILDRQAAAERGEGAASVTLGQVAALLAAMSASPMAEPDFDRFPMPPGWLRERGSALLEKQFMAHSDWRSRFVAAFNDPDFLRISTLRLYGRARDGNFPWWFDDSPRMEVAVSFGDGTQWRAVSDHQSAMMLPWRVERGGQTADTFNPNLSIAVADLLPERAPNQTRLGIEDFVKQLTDRGVVPHVNAAWLRYLQEDPRSPFHFLQQEFDLRRVQIFRPTRSNSGGRPVRSEELVANLSLIPRSSPALVEIWTFFRMPEEQVPDPASVLRTARFLHTHLLKVPWLQQVLTAEPRPRVSVLLRHAFRQIVREEAEPLTPAVSFSADDRAAFLQDMRSLGKEELAREVLNLGDTVVHLQVDLQGQWLVLPDGRTVLWRYRPGSKLLRWHSKDFPAQPCADSDASYMRCLGGVVSPQGEIAP